jgi:SAM-dependent methyltransferase
MGWRGRARTLVGSYEVEGDRQHAPRSTPGRHERSRYFVTQQMPELLRRRAEQAPPRVLADLGAGEGAILYALDRAGLVGERIYAVDLSERSLEIARTLSDKVAPIVADVTDVASLEDGAVDAVTASQVIEHLPDDRRLTAEIARLLRPGGWFYVSSVVRGPHAWWFRRGDLGWQIDPTHVREYASEADFAAALAHPSLQLEAVEARPLRFPLADPLLRAFPRRAVDAYDRSRALARARELVQVPVPGYRWIEAVGRRLGDA